MTVTSADQPTVPFTAADHAALVARVERLEDFAGRLAGLLGAAGQVFDMAKLIEREHLRGDRTPHPDSARQRRRRAKDATS